MCKEAKTTNVGSKTTNEGVVKVKNTTKTTTKAFNGSYIVTEATVVSVHETGCDLSINLGHRTVALHCALPEGAKTKKNERVMVRGNLLASSPVCGNCGNIWAAGMKICECGNKNSFQKLSIAATQLVALKSAQPARDYNRIELTGNLTRDGKVFTSRSGNPQGQAGIAVQVGNNTWFTTAWVRNTECKFITGYEKGNRVFVAGSFTAPAPILECPECKKGTNGFDKCPECGTTAIPVNKEAELSINIGSIHLAAYPQVATESATTD